MSEQIFISYRRDGGDVSAKLICEALKNRGYTVFYDFNSLHGGFFDDRIYNAIEGCNDFVLVLPQGSLDRCVNEDDWVRLEIRHALKYGKNIIPVLLPDFEFPKVLPEDIASIARINGVKFVIDYFDRGVIPEIIDRLSTSAISAPESAASDGLEFTLNNDGNGYSVSFDNCTDADVIIPKLYKGKPVTIIKSGAKFNPNLPNPHRSVFTSFTIPNSIAIIGDRAFDSCKALKSIAIPNSVTTIGKWAFQNCESLISITIPNGITTIEHSTFEYCKSLTSITIPNSVTTIGEDAFLGCDSLTSITIPDSVTTIGDRAFCGCDSLTSIAIPDSVTTIGDSAFCDCESLASINIPNGVTTIGADAFCNCLSLTSINIPNSVKTIEACAFCGCETLMSITIPDSVTTIGPSAFEGCINLRRGFAAGSEDFFNNVMISYSTLVIPSSVTYIGEDAFRDCESLYRVHYNGSIDHFKKISLHACFPPHVIFSGTDGYFKL